MISNFGWLCIIIILGLGSAFTSCIKDAIKYDIYQKTKTDFDYLEYRDK